MVRRKADLPAGAVVELERLLGDGRGLAEAGAYFEDTDAPVTDAPSARFVRAYHVRDAWIIWIERGGYLTVALVPRQRRTNTAYESHLLPGGALSRDLCAQTRALVPKAEAAR